MICWSCERNVDPVVVCPHCKAVLPPEGAADHFAILGVPRRYTIDHDAVEARYREMARRLHPDRFARSDPRERRAAMQRTVQVNEAWRVLRDPFRRAEYLLSLHGVGIGADPGRPASAAQGVQREMAMPPTFLAEMLEKREELGEAVDSGDRKAVMALLQEMRRRASETMDVVAKRLDGEGNADDDVKLEGEAAESTAMALAAVRYFRRCIEQAEAAAESLNVAAGLEMGSAHAG